MAYNDYNTDSDDKDGLTNEDLNDTGQKGGQSSDQTGGQTSENMDDEGETGQNKDR